MQRLAGAQGNQRRTVGVSIILRNAPALGDKRDPATIARQPVKVGAVEAGEGFQAVERAGISKRLGIKLERRVRSSSATAGELLGAARVRRRIMPRKNLPLPEVAAATSAWRIASSLSTGRQ